MAPASETATRLIAWVAASGDNTGLPFAVIDKNTAQIFVFDGGGQLQGQAAVLLGLAPGDDSAPGVGQKRLADITKDERTTPAGRFVASYGFAAGGHKVLWVDYENSISIHAVITTNPKEQRLKRLESPEVDDNRITFGCINVPAAFYEDVVRKTFTGTNGIVYILPDTKAVGDVFPALADGTRVAAAPASTATGEPGGADGQATTASTDPSSQTAAADKPSDQAAPGAATASTDPAAQTAAAAPAGDQPADQGAQAAASANDPGAQAAAAPGPGPADKSADEKAAAATGDPGAQPAGAPAPFPYNSPAQTAAAPAEPPAPASTVDPGAQGAAAPAPFPYNSPSQQAAAAPSEPPAAAPTADPGAQGAAAPAPFPYNSPAQTAGAPSAPEAAPPTVDSPAQTASAAARISAGDLGPDLDDHPVQRHRRAVVSGGGG
jgi:hypothetical protein